MRFLSSRRLTGPNRWTTQPAALAEVDVTSREAFPQWFARLQACVDDTVDALDWPAAPLFQREEAGCWIVGMHPPIDGLYTGCDILEFAIQTLEVDSHDDTPRLSYRRLGSLLRTYQQERNPALRHLAQLATQHHVPFLTDDDHTSLGLGQHARIWPTNDLPSPTQQQQLDWPSFRAIPSVLITGTNGKTTTSRLLTRMAKVGGFRVGSTSTDGLSIDENMVETGDWTGPGGARHILRHNDVSYAVLETARGGMLRRGLVGAVASAAIVTNVSDDHLGEWGIDTVEQMAHVKLLIRQGRLPNTPLFLNCDNSPLYTAATSLHETEGPLCWFSPEQHTPDSFSALPGSLVSWQAQGQLVFQLPGEDTHKLSLQDIPITMQGLAAFNIGNVQAAVLAARQTGISWQAIEEALASFQPSVQDNPGRMNLFTLNDARFVIDFGHNPDGVAALADTVARLPRTGRRLVLIGQAGDRSDPEITGLGISALRCEPDLILIKELEPYLRGRQLGDIPRLIQHALKERGFEATHVEPSERDAVNWAINWAKPGDLVLLFIQASPQHAIQCLLDAGATEGWDA